MGKFTLTIENQPIEFEVDKPGLYPFTINGKEYNLEINDVYPKGYSIKKNENSSVSYWWETETYPLFICSLCGKLFEENSAKGYTENVMRDKLYCFICAHWEIIASYYDNPLIIDGVRYSLGPGSSGGMAGRKFEIEFFDGRKVTTNDLWCQGEIPESFRSRIPDTARFLGGAHFDREVRAWQASK